jgi:hypothetical protein
MLEQPFGASSQTTTYLIADDYYQIYITNDADTRSIGWFASGVSKSVDIYIGAISISPVPWGTPVQFNWSVNWTANSITLDYTTVRGTTYLVEFWLNNSTANVYYANMTTPTGSFVYIGLDQNETYTIHFRANNSEQVVEFSTVIAYGKPAKQPALQIPKDWGSFLFGGLALVVLLVSTPFSAPFGMLIATFILVIAAWYGWLSITSPVLWAFVVLTAIIFLRKGGAEE